MQAYGELLLGLALLWSLAGAGMAFLGARFRRQHLIDGGRYALYALCALFWGCALMLSYAFISHDFANKYVATYSDRGMPTAYLLAAFWGGEKGALLFWVTSLSTFAALSIHSNRNKEPRWIGLTTGILLLIIGFFEMLMVYESNPFETFLTHGGPADGQGMNPLLQNPTMMIHPPSLLTGYITFSIPFAYGLGALIAGKLDTEWIRVTRVWTIVSWLFLSLGLVLGGAWAYQELGWGGYWMWDPVENAGLIPWFTATAFLHSVMIQERRGMLKRWNAILVCLTFLLTIFGTFLTRSQLIASIHAFADSTLAEYFLWLMLGLVVVSAVVIGWRWKELESEHHIDSFWSRESFFVLNNVMLVGCAVIVTWGTLFPKVSELESFRAGFNGLVTGWNATIGGLVGPLEPLRQAVDLGEPWFNKVMAPLGLLLLLLSGAGPIIAWRRATLANFRKNFVRPLLAAVPPTVLSVAAVARLRWHDLQDRGRTAEEAREALLASAGLDEIYMVLGFYLAFFVVATVWMEYSRAVAVRRKRSAGSRLWHALAITLKARRRYGGYIVHVGMVLCFLSFCGSAFKLEIPEQVVHPGDTLEIGGYRLTFARLDETFIEDGRFVQTQATVVVRDRGAAVARDEMEHLAALIDEHELGPAVIEARPGHAKIHVHLPDGESRQRLLAAGLVATELERNYERLDDDTAASARVYRFAHEDVLRLQPTAFMRHVNELKSRVAEIGDLGVTAEFTPGSTVVRLAFVDADDLAAFDAVDALAADLGPHLSVRPGDGPDEVDLVPEGLGRLLLPQVRFYEKHETPTTEVAIESHALEDLYLAMRPAIGKPYINLLTVVFPLVSLLWLGAATMLFGAFIALLPDWAVAFASARPRQQRRGRPSPPAEPAARPRLASWVGLLAAGTLFAGVGGMEAARAQAASAAAEARARSSAPGMADLHARLSCPDRRGGSWIVHEDRTLASCDTAQGVEVRDLLDRLVADAGGSVDDARARSAVLRMLVETDERYDRLLRVPAESFQDLWHNTTCLCGCSHLLFQCGLECAPGADWKKWVRQMLAAGYAKDEALQVYIDYWNDRRPVTAAPYDRETVTKDPDKEGTWAFPLVAGGLGAVAFMAVILRRGRRAGRTAPQASAPAPAPARTERDELIDDLLDDADSPLR